MAMANLAVRFFAEIGGVVALGYWGYQLSGDGPVRTATGIGAAVVLVVVWGTILAPRARSPLSPRQRTAAGTMVLLCTALALAAAGQSTLGLAFGLVILVNAVLLFALPEPAAAAVR